MEKMGDWGRSGGLFALAGDVSDICSAAGDSLSAGDNFSAGDGPFALAGNSVLAGVSSLSLLGIASLQGAASVPKTPATLPETPASFSHTSALSLGAASLSQTSAAPPVIVPVPTVSATPLYLVEPDPSHVKDRRRPKRSESRSMQRTLRALACFCLFTVAGATRTPGEIIPGAVGGAAVAGGVILAAVIAEVADDSQPALSTQPTTLPTADDSEPTMSTPSAASSAPGAEASTDPGPTVVDFGLIFGEPMVEGVAEDLLTSTMLAGIDDREDVGAIVDFCL